MAVYAGPAPEASCLASALLLPLVPFDQLRTRDVRLQTEGQHSKVLDIFRYPVSNSPDKIYLKLDREIIVDPTDNSSHWNRGCLYCGHTFEAIALIVNMKAYHQGAS